ncbi:FAD-binding domain-containing protein [Micromonospora sp. U56]|uniref:FAD-binding domain-containing protein n=1 Tax=Micromonospora sp. U56 TaxID=2824900 RepID=UPI0035A88E45
MADRREELAAPRRVTLPDGVRPGRLPAPPKGESPGAAVGGESVGQRRLTQWLPTLDRYDDIHDDLAGDETSRLSPYLRFGCLSPLAVANRAGGTDGPFVRQLCWRDFYHQVTAAFPDISTSAYRRGASEGWRYDADALAAWTEGRTSVAGKAVHQPWRLPDDVRRQLDYPPPLEVPGADPVWMR